MTGVLAESPCTHTPGTLRRSPPLAPLGAGAGAKGTPAINGAESMTTMRTAASARMKRFRRSWGWPPGPSRSRAARMASTATVEELERIRARMPTKIFGNARLWDWRTVRSHSARRPTHAFASAEVLDPHQVLCDLGGAGNEDGLAIHRTLRPSRCRPSLRWIRRVFDVEFEESHLEYGSLTPGEPRVRRVRQAGGSRTRRDVERPFASVGQRHREQAPSRTLFQVIQRPTIP